MHKRGLLTATLMKALQIQYVSVHMYVESDAVYTSAWLDADSNAILQLCYATFYAVIFNFAL